MIIETEVWLPIEGYPNHFISNLGRVKSTFNGDKILKPGGRPYLSVVLKLKGPSFRVHVLTATYFVPNPNNYKCVNHKDGIKIHNWATNLEWTTHKMNTAHALANGLMKVGEKHPMAKLNEGDVAAIRLLLSSGIKGRDIAEYYPVVESVISRIKTGKLWKDG